MLSDLASPAPVIRENVVSGLRSGVAREPALGIVPLRRRANRGPGCERIGRGIVIEHGVSPSAAVRESLAVFDHEVHVDQVARHGRIGEELVRFRSPMDLRHLSSVRDRLTITGNTGLVGTYHRRIAEVHSDDPFVSTDGDGLPSFVSPELGERKSTRHFHRVLVLRENCQGADNRKPSRNHRNRQHSFTLHYSTSFLSIYCSRTVRSWRGLSGLGHPQHARHRRPSILEWPGRSTEAFKVHETTTRP